MKTSNLKSCVMILESWNILTNFSSVTCNIVLLFILWTSLLMVHYDYLVLHFAFSQEKWGYSWLAEAAECNHSAKELETETIQVYFPVWPRYSLGFARWEREKFVNNLKSISAWAIAVALRFAKCVIWWFGVGSIIGFYNQNSREPPWPSCQCYHIW